MTSKFKTLFFTAPSERRIPSAFFEQILKQGCIWGLRHPEGGWVYCPSNLLPDHDVYLFWSERRLAYRSVQKEWAEFEPIPILLHDFLLNWIDDMILNDTQIGLDWDPECDGMEYSSQGFKRRLCQRLNKQKDII